MMHFQALQLAGRAKQQGHTVGTVVDRGVTKNETEAASMSDILTISSNSWR